MKKYLITGGNSNLARNFYQIFPKDTILVDKQECDITSEKSIVKMFDRHQFKYLVNCAAITDIELCQIRPELCLAINTVGPFLLSQVALRYHKKMINISSDYASNPQNVYGYSKLFSEQILAKNHLSIRTNFYSQETYLIKNLLAHKEVNAYTNVYFNPISINGLIKQIDKRPNQTGVIHILSNQKISYYKFALKFCTKFHLDSALVKKTKYEISELKAPRPTSSYLSPTTDVNLDRDLTQFRQYIQYKFN